MTTVKLPLRSDPNYTVSMVLNGETFNFKFQYNDRSGYNYFSIYTQRGTPIREGVKLVKDWVMLRIVAQRSAPEGYLVTIGDDNLVFQEA